MKEINYNMGTQTMLLLSCESMGSTWYKLNIIKLKDNSLFLLFRYE